MKKGQTKAPAREPSAVFASKMEAAFKSATSLLVKLHAMQRHRAIRLDAELRAKYGRFTAAIAERVNALGPIEASAEQKPTLESWLQ